MRVNKKGFVLTMDAMIAVAVAFTASIAIITIFSSGVAKPETQQLTAIGNDLLSVLYHNKTFNNYIGASETVNADIANKLAILPPQLCGNLTVTVYDADNFASSKQYSAASCSRNGDISKAKRLFADYNKKKFGIAEVELWLR